MVEDPPYIRLLEALKATIDPVDYEAEAGIEDVNTRHQRHRYAADEEKPALSVRFTNDVPRGDDLDHNQWETLRELAADLVADVKLPPEDSAEDPTGLLTGARLLAAAMKAVRDPSSPIALLCDRVILGVIGGDEDSNYDVGRLVCGVTVVYRVRSDDENQLLAQGVMG